MMSVGVYDSIRSESMENLKEDIVTDSVELSSIEVNT